jgi:EmrB/QacA subfamily drug resistance transporter
METSAVTAPAVPPVPLSAAAAARFPTDPRERRKRWMAFTVLCLGTLMVVLDTTVVNVAAPSIQEDLGFSEANLAWIVNAYMLTFGGFLLLGGRMGDLYGPRKLFLAGLLVFTAASLWCGLAQTQTQLIVARAVQGLGAAVVSAVSMALIMNLFPAGPERVKAMGYFGFVASGGGAVGAAVGGYITGNFDWHWNFLINLPIGVGVLVASLRLIDDLPGAAGGRLDLAGAGTITLSLLLAVYAVVEATTRGWTSPITLLRFAGSAALLVAFLAIERRVRNPLVPLGMFRQRNIVVSNLVAVLWAGSMFAWFFLSAQYMQKVLGEDPQTIGLVFVPADVIMMAFSVSLSARMVNRFGTRIPLGLGLTLAGIGLLLFARAPVDGNLWIDVLPGMLILGIGAGMAFNPMLLSAMSDAKPDEAGLASGLVNTSFMMGGALGLAVLASLSASRFDELASRGLSEPAALNGGYHLAFLLGGLAAIAAGLMGAFLLKPVDIASDGAAPMAH